jgi:thiamine biosynthesis lipoprotein
MLILLYALALGAGGAAAGEAPKGEEKLSRFEASEIHMGVDFTIVLYAVDQAAADGAFKAAFARIKQLDGVMSDYDLQSELSRLCDAAPTKQPVPLSDDFYRVLEASLVWSRASGGAFDVTVGPVVRLWRRARRQQQLPSAERLKEALASVGYQHLRLDAAKKTAELLRPGMRLDLGGIGQGFAVDEALKTLRELGIGRALVNGSGDIGAGDPPPGEEGWKVGIAPLEPGGKPSRVLLLANRAVSTSGDAFQFVEVGGVRYSHIVDPKTGLGLTDHSSVSVLAPDCTTADALASAVSVLGPEKGLALVERTAGAAALILRAPQGKVETHVSKRFDGAAAP